MVLAYNQEIESSGLWCVSLERDHSKRRCQGNCTNWSFGNVSQTRIAGLYPVCSASSILPFLHTYPYPGAFLTFHVFCSWVLFLHISYLYKLLIQNQIVATTSTYSVNSIQILFHNVRLWEYWGTGSLFDYWEIRAIQRFFRSSTKVEEMYTNEPVVRLNEVQSGHPVFFVCPLDGVAVPLWELGQKLSVPAFCFQVTPSTPAETIEDTASYFLKVLSIYSILLWFADRTYFETKFLSYGTQVIQKDLERAVPVAENFCDRHTYMLVSL